MQYRRIEETNEGIGTPREAMANMAARVADFVERGGVVIDARAHCQDWRKTMGGDVIRGNHWVYTIEYFMPEVPS